MTINDNDVFVGTRLALNDIQDTAVLAGVAYDTDIGETFVNIEALVITGLPNCACVRLQEQSRAIRRTGCRRMITCS